MKPHLLLKNRHHRILFLTLLIIAAVSLSRWRHQPTYVSGDDSYAANDSPVIQDTINPNYAAWASLARLPGIGPTRAQAIVHYRQNYKHPKTQLLVFRCAEDLTNVHGIGPVTVEQIKPYLQFDNP